MPWAELLRRQQLAEQACRTNVATAAGSTPQDCRPDRCLLRLQIGGAPLWHPTFGQSFATRIGAVTLYQVGAWLAEAVAGEPEPLDYWDFGLLADALRMAIADNKRSKQRASWQRALSWVESQAAGLTPPVPVGGGTDV